MNPYIHAEISVKKRGGVIDDYYPIHFFMDSTKELCSDNRHRILHNLWGIRRVIIPIFGSIILNEKGKKINVKDLCEQDHILPDFSNKFIPTLSDFVDEFEELNDDEIFQINKVYSLFEDHKEIQSLLISPLNVTGEIKSLRLTHNTWFCNEIIPRIFSKNHQVRELGKISIFEKMNFAPWMDNGSELPRSCLKIKNII
ncbi:MAG: hypothetical protein AB8H03_00375 [Saprospiraceae bacterium]